jgi:hypothetical protein
MTDDSSPTSEELATAREPVRAAQARGVSFADTADGVLKALTNTVVETALEGELSDHLGYDQNDPAGRQWAATCATAASGAATLARRQPAPVSTHHIQPRRPAVVRCLHLPRHAAPLAQRLRYTRSTRPACPPHPHQ